MAIERQKAKVGDLASPRSEADAEALPTPTRLAPEHARLLTLQTLVGNRVLARQIDARGAAPRTVVQRDPQARASLHTSWYVETDPASSLAPIGTPVTFKLRNAAGNRYERWQPIETGGEERPRVTITRDGRPMGRYYPRHPNYPVTFEYTFTRPGHYLVGVDGIPMRGGVLATQGQPIHVSLAIQAVAQLTRATLEANSQQATTHEDLTHLEDPDASGPEMFQAFRRLAVRHAINTVNRNKQEAIDQLALYTRGGRGRTATQAAQDVQRVIDFDFQLEGQIARLRQGFSWTDGPEARRRQRLQLERINLARASLIDAFPVVARVGRGDRWVQMEHGDTARDLEVIQEALRQVMRDCDRTRQALATGDLDVIGVESVITATRTALGIDADPRRRQAVDRGLSDARAAGLARAAALGAGMMILLLVPGLGPYMAAVAGAVGAGVAWEEAEDLRAAEGAGVRGGLVSTPEAQAAGFWAAIATILAGLDVAQAARALRAVVPHVAAAADRVIPRASGELAEEVGGAAAPRAAAAGQPVAGAPVRPPVQMDEAEMRQFASRILERDVPNLRGRMTLADSQDAFNAEYRTRWPIQQFPEPIPAGYFFVDAAGIGRVRFSPEADDLLTRLHEIIHLVSHEKNPIMRRLLGEFIDEGITEAIVRTRLGPMPGAHGYDAQVAFVQALGSRIGRRVLEGAVLDGNFMPVSNAVEAALGGSGARRLEFFILVRRISSGGAVDQVALAEALRIVSQM